MGPRDILHHHSFMIHGSKESLSGYDRRGMSMWQKSKFSGINKEDFMSYENCLKDQLKYGEIT